ncbi:MAG: AGE family epimerase/isomerase [Candidatus Lernaella stagnicola]|nr:AGE family epimerase/isomerase [Candidatus Lernaella stagnicola]
MNEALAAKCRTWRDEAHAHLTRELLPFWLTRARDDRHGGLLTHADRHGNDPGTDEKSLISQTRTIYTMSAAHRAGYGEGRAATLARYGVDFLLAKFWDPDHGGFYWMADRTGKIGHDAKVLYGHAFAVYGLSEYTLATGDPRGRDFAARTFDLIAARCREPEFGGYREMFARDWTPAGPGAAGGDRKTFDVHMHLMEAFAALAECTGEATHRDALHEVIGLLCGKMLHAELGTGIPQFDFAWHPRPLIRFDIVWGHDRFSDGGVKPNPDDITSFGHNVEFAWLLRDGLRKNGMDIGVHRDVSRRLYEHALASGIDWKHGGVYVEGPHSGGVYDTDKEFWQQAESLVGMLDAYELFGREDYLDAYEAVHRFVFDHVINHEVGEWRPLLTQEGRALWHHLGDSWKTNYHTVRSMIEVIRRLNRLLASN